MPSLYRPRLMSVFIDFFTLMKTCCKPSFLEINKHFLHEIYSSFIWNSLKELLQRLFYFILGNKHQIKCDVPLKRRYWEDFTYIDKTSSMWKFCLRKFSSWKYDSRYAQRNTARCEVIPASPKIVPAVYQHTFYASSKMSVRPELFLGIQVLEI